MPTKAPRPATSMAEPAGVLAVQVADEHPVGRQLLVQDDVQIVQGIGAEADGDRDAGVPGGAGGAAEQALLGRGHAGAVGDGRDDAGGGAALDPGNHHPLSDLLAEEIGELLGRPRGGRVGLRRQEVSAEFFLRAQARGGDDVDAGGAGQRLVELEVAAVEHARAVDDRLRRRARGSPSSLAARASKISARSMEMSGAYWAPGTTDNRASWTATTPSSAAGTGPNTVLTVCPVGAWNASPLSTGVV